MKLPRITLFALLLILTVIGFLVARLFLPVPGPEQVTRGTEAEKLAVAAAVDLIKLVIGWSVALIGALAYLYTSMLSARARESSTRLVAAGFIATLWSLFAGYVALDRIVLLLALQRINLNDYWLNVAVDVQYYSFLAALACFMWIATRAIAEEKPSVGF